MQCLETPFASTISGGNVLMLASLWWSNVARTAQCEDAGQRRVSAHKDQCLEYCASLRLHLAAKQLADWTFPLRPCLFNRLRTSMCRGLCRDSVDSTPWRGARLFLRSSFMAQAHPGCSQQTRPASNQYLSNSITRTHRDSMRCTPRTRMAMPPPKLK